jgi:signal transduction histidine kinase
VSVMSRLWLAIERLGSIGDQPDDPPDEQRRHRLLIYMATLMSCAGICWGLIAGLLGLLWPCIIPLSYVAGTVLNLSYFRMSRNFHVVQVVQVGMSLLLPFLFQWSVGGFVASGAGMMWALIALMGSLTFTETRASAVWLVLFLGLTAVAGFVDPTFARDAVVFDVRITALFFSFNFGFIGAIVAGLTIWLQHQRDLAVLAAENASDALKGANLDLEEKNVALGIAAESADKASRTKDEFLASMSHELRTPLNVILNVSELIQEGIYGPVTEKQKRSVGMVETSGLHLLSLIDDILDLAKVGTNTLTLSMETISPEDVCHSSIRFIQESADAKRLKVLTTFDLEVTTLFADERRLKQILINLLNNAVKFTPEGGSVGVEVTSRAENNAVLFTVWDTGIGISPEEQKLLFKPFVQLDAGLSRQYEGTGLGLSLVARMTELHGGSVHLESPGHGHGARFTISIPRSDAIMKGSSNA